MARAQKQIESQLAEIKRQIQDAQELQAIATFGGADKLLSLLNRTRDFYVQAMQNLDESGPALDREYAKRRACLTLVDGFLNGMAGANDKIAALKTQFLALNEELGKVMDEAVRREKTSM